MTRRMGTTIVIGCMLLVSGCSIGRNVKKEPAAITAEGAAGWVEANRVRYEGTLLAVTDSSVLLQLRTTQRLVEIPNSTIRQFDFWPFKAGSRPDAAELLVLRRASRFPFGIPDAALATLLARADQTSIEKIQ